MIKNRLSISKNNWPPHIAGTTTRIKICNAQTGANIESMLEYVNVPEGEEILLKIFTGCLKTNYFCLYNPKSSSLSESLSSLSESSESSGSDEAFYEITTDMTVDEYKQLARILVKRKKCALVFVPSEIYELKLRAAIQLRLLKYAQVPLLLLKDYSLKYASKKFFNHVHLRKTLLKQIVVLKINKNTWFRPKCFLSDCKNICETVPSLESDEFNNIDLCMKCLWTYVEENKANICRDYLHKLHCFCKYC